MSDVSNLSDTIIPKSDQLNAEQLLAGPMTITVTDVRRGTDDQPVIINYHGDAGRPYKPCKTMRKVLIFAWGDDGREWIGRSMTLYSDPSVKFGGVKVGGLRISHMSHIDRDIAISLTATKGKKEPVLVRLMQAPAAVTLAQVMQAMDAAMTPDALKAAAGIAGKLSSESDRKSAETHYRATVKRKREEAAQAAAGASPAGSSAPTLADALAAVSAGELDLAADIARGLPEGQAMQVDSAIRAATGA